MSDNFAADLFNRMGMGNAKADSKGSDSTNEKDILEAALGSGEATAKIAGKAVLGMDLSQLGQVALTQPIDSEGLQGKTIPSIISQIAPQGGWLARLAHAIFVKNSAITDHTGGVGGSADGGGGGGDYSSGGGGGGGDFSSYDSTPNFSSMASHSHDFEWSSVSMAMLGDMPRPASPSMGPSMGEGYSMGA